jgi:peptide/nickel transport system ATP-binding protein
MSSPTFFLSVKNLQTVFSLEDGRLLKAVNGVSFDLKNGEILGLAGESACGKSTLAYSILRLLPANGRIIGGEVILNEKDLLKMTEDEFNKVRWKEISIIFQGALNALNPTMTIVDQIVEPIITHDTMSKEMAKNRAVKLIEQVGITKQFINSYPHELSGGMKQRAMIAMALACEPKMLIADESTTALDVIVQKKILDLLKEIQQKMNLSMIIISHDLSVIAQTCHRCAIMYAGKIVELADVEPLFNENHHPYTKALINAFPDIRSNKLILGIPGVPPNLSDLPSGCSFHPRCPLAQTICSNVEPPLEEKHGHLVACHFA